MTSEGSGCGTAVESPRFVWKWTGATMEEKECHVTEFLESPSTPRKRALPFLLLYILGLYIQFVLKTSFPLLKQKKLSLF